jgi:hypothetical protein
MKNQVPKKLVPTKILGRCMSSADQIQINQSSLFPSTNHSNKGVSNISGNQNANVSLIPSFSKKYGKKSIGGGVIGEELQCILESPVSSNFDEEIISDKIVAEKGISK